MKELKKLLKEEKHDEFLKQFPENNNFLLCDFVKLRNATKDKVMQDVINEFIKKRFKEWNIYF